MSATKATGGSVSFHGGKTIHTFVGSGSLVVPATISDVEYVLVGGGGAGRSRDPGYAGGGGGAGGYINKTGQSLSAATYPVSIGAGGAINADGGNSTFNSETALVVVRAVMQLLVQVQVLVVDLVEVVPVPVLVVPVLVIWTNSTRLSRWTWASWWWNWWRVVEVQAR